VETESELVAEGLAVEAIGFNDNYGMDPLPERVTGWVKRWQEQRALAADVATEIHAGWRALTGISTMGGRLVFAYFRGPSERRECGGLFTVPYLARRDELVALIGKHRPGDYAGNYDPGATPHAGITWVPGHEVSP
jgi:hypothetical protein